MRQTTKERSIQRAGLRLAAAALAGAALASAPGDARAEFALESSTPAARSAEHGFAAALRFREDSWKLPDSFRLVPPPIPNGFGDYGEDIQGVAPEFEVLEEQFAATSTFLAVPGASATTAEEWTIHWSLEGSRGRVLGIAGDAVWARPASIGTLEGVQVFVDRRALADRGGLDLAADALDLRIDLSGPPARELPRATIPLREAGGFEHFVQRFALNAADVREVPIATADARGRSSAPLPEPPGAIRLSYLSVSDFGEPLAGEILRVPLDELGVDEAGAAGLRLVWSGNLIPLGGVVDGSDAWFHAPRRHTPTDTHNAVFATADADEPSPAMAARPAFESLAPQGVEAAIPRHRRYEYNLVYERDAILPPGERLVWWQLRSNATRIRERQLPVHDVLTEPTVALRANVLALNTTLNVDPDHYVDLALAGQPIPRASWKGRTARIVEGEVQVPLPNGQNLLFRHEVPNNTPLGGGADIQNLESVELWWTGKPRVDGAGIGRIELGEAEAPRIATIGGFPAGTTAADVVLLDITDESTPVRVLDPMAFEDDSGTVAFEFEAPAAASSFIIQRIAALAAPDEIAEAERLPELPDGMLRGIIVRPEAYAGILEPLVQLRGPGIIGLDPQAAYNAFNDGMKSPDAVRDALRELLDAAPSRAPLPGVLLVGHASFDSRNALRGHQSLKVPAYIDLGNVDYGGATRENPSDFRFGLLFGDDDLHDVALGRMAPRFFANVTSAVDRYIAHAEVVEDLRGEPRLGYVLTDHSSPTYAYFGNDAPFWRGLWEQADRPSDWIDIFNATTARPTVHGRFSNPAGGGVGFALYVGHGNFEKWMQGAVVNRSHVFNDINTNAIWPLVASLTCQNGLYSHPALETQYSLADAWLFASPTRGATGFLTTASEDTYGVMRPVVEEVMKGFGETRGARATTAGELSAAAMIGYVLRFPNTVHYIAPYHLFGDPFVDLTLDPTAFEGLPASWMLLGPEGE